jgi:hypothetical protein
MSMTVVNAKIYVARIIGGGAESQESLDMAGEAILRAYQDWQNKKFWRFLLKDTSVSGQTLSVHCHSGQAFVHEPSDPATPAGLLDAINIGDTFTAAANFTGTITVLSYTRASNGSINLITFDKNSSATGNDTLTRTSANIPMKPTVNDYNLPLDFFAPFSCLLLTNKRTMTFRDQRWWDRVIVDQTNTGTPTDYGVYNAYSEETQNFGVKHLKFDRIPDVTDTIFMRYYRSFNTTGTYIDVIDDFLYQFLDYSRAILLATKRAQDDPEGYAKMSMDGTTSAVQQDEQVTDDDDADRGLKSQYEVGDFNRPLWGNGPFDPYRY